VDEKYNDEDKENEGNLAPNRKSECYSYY